MIVYLHGFGSTGASAKVDRIRAAFPDETVVAPNLPPEPNAVVETVRNIVQTGYRNGEKKVLFIGTSMGGFYSWYFGAMFDAPAILINPSIRPHETTAKWIGQNTNYATGAKFDWKPEYLDQLRTMVEWVNANYDPRQIETVVALDDAVIEAKSVIDHFGQSTHQYPDGGHRFDDIDRVFPLMRDRYQAIREQIDPEF